MKTLENACGACGEFYTSKEVDKDGFHSPDFCSASSNKIIKATCLKCSKWTTDPDTLLIMNDLDCLCQCGARFVRWDFQNGSVITLEIEDYKGDFHYFREEQN